MAAAGRLSGRDKIGVRVGKVIGKYKVGKHFDLDIKDAAFAFSVNEERAAAEAALDGLYVIRTFAAEAGMSAEAAVLNYKRLAEVERAFRTLKGVDLQVRPIRHRLESRVKAHIFLSMWLITCNGIWLKLEAAPLRRRSSGERGARARAGGSGQALRRCARQGADPAPRRRHARL